MKTCYYIIVAFTLLGCASTEKSLDEYVAIREIPEDAVKSIKTTHYAPLLHNGKLICGDEIFQHSSDDYEPTGVVYYDEYNNPLLKVFGYAGHLITRYYYSDKHLGEIDRILMVESKKRGREAKEDARAKVMFNRDDKGNLLEIQHCRDTAYSYRLSPEETICTYSEDGKRTEKRNDHLVEFSFTPSKEGFVSVIKTISDDYEYWQEGEYGLRRKQLKIFGRDSLLKRVIDRNYAHGHLHSTKNHTMSYNAKGMLVKEEIEESSVPRMSIDPRLGEEEIKQYIIDTYYSPPQYINKIEVSKWEYNSHGDITSSLRQDDELGTLSFSEEYDYEYNDHNEWIKRVTYGHKDLINSKFSFHRAGMPKCITIREIIYY